MTVPIDFEIPDVCPWCGRRLHYTNAIDVCGVYMVFCPSSVCRWCIVLEFDGYPNIWSKA